MRTSIAILILVSLAMTAVGKVKTTRKGLRSDAVQVMLMAARWIRAAATPPR